MKTVKVEEKGNEVLRKLAKKFRISKKEMVNMVLENLTEEDVLMIQRRDRAVGVSVGVEEEDDDDDKIEFEGYDEDGNEIDEDDEQEYEEEDEEEKPADWVKYEDIKK